jgi:putative tryptophan/tyrosine transport system substrate-binding protein
MTRRTIGLLVTLALGLLMAPPATYAQQVGKVARIGWLLPFRSGPRGGANVFRQAMRELGWEEGQNLVLDFRYAELQYDRLPELAAELVRLHPDVIIGHTTLSAMAAKSATTTIPIVMIFVDDAVSEGLVASLPHPGGNITGLSMQYTEVSGKRLEFLRQVVPNLARVAVLYNPTYPAMARSVRETQVAAQALGVTLQLVEVRDPSELEDAFAAMTRAHAEALLVLIDPLVNDYRERLADLAVRRQLPTMFDERGQVESGGLLAYGAYWPDVIRRAAYYVDRILKGAKPADLPVEQPTKFELVINLKTAQVLGLTIPQTLLFQADEVIR